MDAAKNSDLPDHAILSSTPSISRESNTVRIKPNKHASSTSLKQARTLSLNNQSLTSLPSLSPSLQNSADKFSYCISKPSRKILLGDAPQDRPQKATSSIKELLSFVPPASERSALFEDTLQDIHDVPGTLHHQSDEQVSHLLNRVSPVVLVKQLAEDLAQRDAQVTLLQRRAEERERLLRNMLRECEVSNLNIENRLRELERNENPRSGAQRDMSIHKCNASELGTRPEDSMSARLSEAFADSIISADEAMVDSLGFYRETREEEQSLLHTLPDSAARGGETSFSGKGHRQVPETSRGWKDYFTSSTATVRKSSVARGPLDELNVAQIRSNPSSISNYRETAREGLASDVFKSPLPILNRTVSGTETLQEGLRRTLRRQPSAGDPNKSGGSAASWTLKLVAGNSQVQGESHRQKSIRQRAVTVSTDSGDGYRTRHIVSDGRADFRTSSGGVNRRDVKPTSPRSSTSISSGPNGTVKKAATDLTRNTRTMGLGSNRPPVSVKSTATNLGPLEMDAILPEEIRPPTLLAQYQDLGESFQCLTDRFGFIYDQRRRVRQTDAVVVATHMKRGSQVESLGNPRRSINGVGLLNDDGVSVSSINTLSSTTSRPDTPGSTEEQAEFQPEKQWQDFLKLSSSSSELLSHTPSAPPITNIAIAETKTEGVGETSQIIKSIPGSGPAPTINPAPSPSRAVSDYAELARPSVSGHRTPATPFASQHDPVKSLLHQLTEVHDSLQREKTAKWNEFLRKVRAERQRDAGPGTRTGKRDGSRSSGMPEASMADGELIGFASLCNKGKVGRAKWTEFKNLVLSGIPVAYRAKVWAECSGALDLRVPGYYDDLVKSSENDDTIVQQIQMDIGRTLTDNIFFRNGKGVNKLSEVLLAYARRNPEIGYCQGMNLITGNLLLIMPTAEDAFWMLTSMIENILPDKYYDHSLRTSRADQVVLRQYVAEVLPQLSKHFDDLSIELEAVTFQWFLSVFTDCLSAEALFRVWDMVLCVNDGATFLFQVALALLKLNEKSLLVCGSPAEVYGYINQKMTDHDISIDGLIRASEGLKKVVLREEVIARRADVVKKELQTNRQREAMRKGKGKAAKYVAVTQDNRQDAKVDQTADATTGRLIQPTSRAEEEFEEYVDLQVKTPMPIDEEALWRA